jgi:hypothetical protein
MENFSLRILHHGMLHLVLLVLVPRLHLPGTELLQLPMLDQTRKQSCQSDFWNELRNGLATYYV